MKYCFSCGRITAGEPRFCNSCGRSYDVKLCPRMHANPRFADVCSQCGSRELSTPQPRVSLWWHVLGFSIRVVLGALLVAFSLAALVGVVQEMLRSPQVQAGMVALALLLVALWFLWAMIPHWLRKIIHRSRRPKEGRNEH
jgi:hypothetical protein